MIDSKIQVALRERFNSDGSELRKHQIRMLDMLKSFDEICRKNNIKYWLSSGTLLGAVRHHGFIPWDDDADVEMLREDYLKLLKVFKETDQYVLQTKDNDLYYVAPYAKLRDKKSFIEEYGQDSNYKYRGVYIDVFVLEKSDKYIAYFYEWLMWKVLNYGSRIKMASFQEKLFCLYKRTFFCSIAIVRFLFSQLPTNELRHTYGAGFHNNLRYTKEIFPLSYCEFEGYSFPVPGSYDVYLRRIYGDYMKLPNLDNIQKHTLKVKIYE